MKTPQRTDFRFHHRLRVRWAEIDMQKIVFNSHYLMYVDTAIADYWRAMALPYEHTMLSLEGDLYVKKATVEYHASARLDDQLDVAIRCSGVGTSSILFTCAIFRDEACLISCDLVYVFADPATQTSKPVPSVFREILQAYEADETMPILEVGNWADLGELARKVRTEVFVQEQGIAIDLECDAADEIALHALVRNRLGLPIATGRLLQHAPGVGRIGRMAVNRGLRGSRLGSRVLALLMQAAAERGDREVLLHAQRSAQGFYTRLGFETRGEPFEEAGIAHIEMVHAL